MPPLKNDYFSSSIDIKELKSLDVKHIIYVISIFLSEQYQIYTGELRYLELVGTE